jgi:hypothetical protein
MICVEATNVLQYSILTFKKNTNNHITNLKFVQVRKDF